MNKGSPIDYNGKQKCLKLYNIYMTHITCLVVYLLYNFGTIFIGPRSAQGLTKAAMDAAQSAVNQRLSGGGKVR